MNVQGKADGPRKSRDTGEPMLDDRAELATAPSDDGMDNNSAADVAATSRKLRGGGSGGGGGEWRSSHPVEAGASCTFNNSRDNYDGERSSDGVVGVGRQLNRSLTGKGRDQGGSETEEAKIGSVLNESAAAPADATAMIERGLDYQNDADEGSAVLRARHSTAVKARTSSAGSQYTPNGDMSLSVGNPGGRRPSSSYAKRPRFNAPVPAVGDNQGTQHQRNASSDTYVWE